MLYMILSIKFFILLIVNVTFFRILTSHGVWNKRLLLSLCNFDAVRWLKDVGKGESRVLTYWSASVLEMLNKPFPPSKNRYMMIGLFGLFKMYFLTTLKWICWIPLLLQFCSVQCVYFCNISATSRGLSFMFTVSS